jgi:hypothetical protein
VKQGKILRAAVLAALLAAGSPVLAQSLSDQPGYVDFGDLDSISSNEPEVEISLTPMLIRFLCAAVQDEDEDLADTLCKLRSIRISVFELAPEDYAQAKEKADEISKALEAKGWEAAVVMRAEDSTVRLYMRLVGEMVAGMAVMVIEPGSDAVFMNIVGEIDPAQLGRVAAQFGVDLNDIKVDSHSKD